MNKVRVIAIVAGVGSLLVFGGCGPKLVPVAGVVTLDGQPVEGATVTFLSEDGNHTYSGSTDASGNFTIQSGEQIGTLPGTYKVTVVKSHKKPAAEAPDPASVDMAKAMKKEAETMAKTTGATTGPVDMRAKMMAGGKGGPGGPKGPTMDTELPAQYAIGSSTPLTVKIPSDGPIRLELKSK